MSKCTYIVAGGVSKGVQLYDHISHLVDISGVEFSRLEQNTYCIQDDP